MRIVFFALWVPVAVVASLAVARVTWRETRTPLVALLVAVIAAAGLVAFPRAVLDAASAARTDRNFDVAQSHRSGGPEDCLVKFVTCVNESVWADLRQDIPAHDSYYVQTSSARIRFFTYTSLLPRIAVQDPRRAEWIVSYRHDPHGLGVGIARTWMFGPVSTKQHERGTLVLAKVKR
ncbi:MAG: hypothetical protein ACRDLM_06640 [Gaiellaceae bacterium]